MHSCKNQSEWPKSVKVAAGWPCAPSVSIKRLLEQFGTACATFQCSARPFETFWIWIFTKYEWGQADHITLWFVIFAVRIQIVEIRGWILPLHHSLEQYIWVACASYSICCKIACMHARQCYHVQMQTTNDACTGLFRQNRELVIAATAPKQRKKQCFRKMAGCNYSENDSETAFRCFFETLLQRL